MIHRRFFVKPENISDDNVNIVNKDDIHHILRVLRLKEKDNIIVLDGLGNEYNVVISLITADAIEGKIVEKIIHSQQKIELTLVQALPKTTKMELIISKCTELGITRIVPVKTQRSIVSLKEESNKLERWKRIAKSSASQCQRVELPIINPITILDTSLSLIKEVDLGLILYEEETKRLLREVFYNIQINKLKKVAIWVGPEGGWTHQEIQKAESMGIISVSLGQTLLKCETAAIIGCSIILYELGVLG